MSQGFCFFSVPTWEKITSDNWTYIRSLIRQKWSPDQIDQWLKKHPDVGFTVSRETIYQYIKEDRQKDGDLYLSLRMSYVSHTGPVKW